MKACHESPGEQLTTSPDNQSMPYCIRYSQSKNYIYINLQCLYLQYDLIRAVVYGFEDILLQELFIILAKASHAVLIRVTVCVLVLLVLRGIISPARVDL